MTHTFLTHDTMTHAKQFRKYNVMYTQTIHYTLNPVHNIYLSERSIFAFYSSVVTHIQIIIYALPVTTQCIQIHYAHSSVYCDTGFSMVNLSIIGFMGLHNHSA